MTEKGGKIEIISWIKLTQKIREDRRKTLLALAKTKEEKEKLRAQFAEEDRKREGRGQKG